MKRQNIYDSENFSQFKQNQSMAADANAKQRRREGERKRLRMIESGRAGEIAKEREPVYRLVSSWSGVNCE